jgi:hypothetical protein
VRVARRHWAASIAAAVAALAVFALSFGAFSVAPTDISAWRMTLGDVPYRDFWTMYSPGSFIVLAGLFELFGRELLISRVAGNVASAAAVGLFCLLAMRLGGRRAGLLASGVVIAAFFQAGYYRALGSYPTALPLLLGAALALTPSAGPRRSGRPAPLEPARTLLAGGLIGAAIVCKHDVGGYALIALAAAVLVSAGGRLRDRMRTAAMMTAAAGAIVVPVVAWLVAAGAGPAAFDALVRFPLTDFPYVRPEAFPLVPRFSGDIVADVRSGVRWLLGHAPGIAILVSMAVLVRRGALSRLPLAAWWAVFMFPLVWTAAHVQFNTHAITLPLLGALVSVAARGAGGAASIPGDGGTRRRPQIAGTATAAWIAVVAVDPAYQALERLSQRPQALGVPHLAGISEPAAERAWARQLAAALREAAPAEAPLLLVAARNDVVIFVDTAPYWLSDRRPASRHHEPHPAITDTETGQRDILNAVAAGPPPVIVRERRFQEAHLDDIERAFQAAGVGVGATILDDWIAARYRPAGRYGRYELMVPCGAAGDHRGTPAGCGGELQPPRLPFRGGPPAARR